MATATVETNVAGDLVLVKLTEQVEFTDESIGADNVSWEFGDGNTSSERNPIHNYTDNGEYTVTFIAFNDFGQSSTQQTIIVTGIGEEIPNVDEPKDDNPIEPPISDEPDEPPISDEPDEPPISDEPDEPPISDEPIDEDLEPPTEPRISTEPRPTNPPSGYNPLFGNFKRGATSPERQWIWSGFIWNANPNYELVEEEEEEVIVREERDEIVVNRRRPRDNIRETTRGY